MLALEAAGVPLVVGSINPPPDSFRHARLEAPHLHELLDAHAAASPRFRGVRDMLAHNPDRMVMNYDARLDRFTDPAWREGYAALGRRGLSFDAWMYQPQLRAFSTFWISVSVPTAPKTTSSATT